MYGTLCVGTFHVYSLSIYIYIYTVYNLQFISLYIGQYAPEYTYVYTKEHVYVFSTYEL
mgnify:CR=1 FL=1